MANPKRPSKRRQSPKRDLDERVAIPLDPEEALRALLDTPPQGDDD